MNSHDDTKTLDPEVAAAASIADEDTRAGSYHVGVCQAQPAPADVPFHAKSDSRARSSPFSALPHVKHVGRTCMTGHAAYQAEVGASPQPCAERHYEEGATEEPDKHSVQPADLNVEVACTKDIFPSTGLANALSSYRLADAQESVRARVFPYPTACAEPMHLDILMGRRGGLGHLAVGAAVRTDRALSCPELGPYPSEALRCPPFPHFGNDSDNVDACYSIR